MRQSQFRAPRRGSVLPLVAGGIIGLVGMAAFAIDLGLIALTRNQCQNAADAAAITALRQLNGDAAGGFGLTAASTQARSIASSQRILGQAVDPSTQLTLNFGVYSYNDAPGVKAFQQIVPRPVDSTENYTLTEAIVSSNRPSAFGRVFGLASYNLQATARAIHRPRDIALVLDFSGSMNNESDLWNNESYLGTANNSPNNADPLVPRFGHYSLTSNGQFSYPGGSAFNQDLLVQTNTDDRVGRCNITTTAKGTDPMAEDYFADPLSSAVSPYGTVRAFGPPDATGRWSVPTSPTASSWMYNPSGDIPLRRYGRVNAVDTQYPYARTLKQILNQTSGSTTRDSNWETYGYDWFYGYNSVAKINGVIPDPNNLRPRSAAADKIFRGTIVGPGYWGATFFIWPPDPRAPVGYPGDSNYVPGDWRRRYFFTGETTAPQDDFSNGIRDNTRLYSSTGDWKDPTTDNTAYRINYRAILRWIRSTGVFPDRLRCGRVLYYDAIPTDITSGAYNWSTLNRSVSWDTTGNAGHPQNQRFWKEYIDYVVGVWRSPANGVSRPASPAMSYGPDFVWQRLADGSESSNVGVQINAMPTDGSNRYMNYDDRPKFPRHRFWFGPMTMIQFISDTGLLPGPAHDNSMFTMKVGIQAAFQDIKQNYPNSQASLAFFNRPHFNGEGFEIGKFSTPQVPLTNDYAALISGLWYPPGTTASSNVRPWDDLAEFIPRAYGDFTGNTASAYGFILAHNQLTSAVEARTAGSNGTAVGGFGRKGADRLVIFETDGMANVGVTAPFVKNSASPQEGYYNIAFTRNGDNASTSVITSGAADTTTYNVVNRLVALDTDTTNGPGFARANQPVTIHCLAFGAVFEGTASGSEQANATTFLSNVSTKGNTVFPASANDPDNGYKWVIGTMDQRRDRLRTAVLNAMRAGVRIALVR